MQSPFIQDKWRPPLYKLLFLISIQAGAKRIAKVASQIRPSFNTFYPKQSEYTNSDYAVWFPTAPALTASLHNCLVGQSTSTIPSTIKSTLFPSLWFQRNFIHVYLHTKCQTIRKKQCETGPLQPFLVREPIYGSEQLSIQ